MSAGTDGERSPRGGGGAVQQARRRELRQQLEAVAVPLVQRPFQQHRLTRLNHYNFEPKQFSASAENSEPRRFS